MFLYRWCASEKRLRIGVRSDSRRTRVRVTPDDAGGTRELRYPLQAASVVSTSLIQYDVP